MTVTVKREEWGPAPRAGPPGTALAAVGDIHAQARLLGPLEDAIRGDLLETRADRRVLVRLGDYLDRGADVRETLALVSAPPPPGIEVVNLMGNHDLCLLFALEAKLTEPQIDTWLFRNGGQESLMALGLTDVRSAESLRDSLETALGAEHSAFFRNLDLQHREGDYLFAHAGIDPEQPLDEQDVIDLVWIRDRFLEPATWRHPVVVVHGHTPSFEPEVRAHRIGIDTGAFYSGRLTALEIVDTRMRFVTAQYD